MLQSLLIIICIILQKNYPDVAQAIAQAAGGKSIIFSHDTL